MTLRDLVWMGISHRVAKMLDEALTRERGMVVVCGATGSGKTSLVDELLTRHPGVRMVGDLRDPQQTRVALEQAAITPAIGVVRSGGSFGLASRWDDMGIPPSVVAAASVITVTLRRPPRSRPVDALSSDILVVEIIGADRRLLTCSLADEAAAHDFENRTAKRAGALNVSVPGDFEPHMKGIASWFRERSVADSRTANAPPVRPEKKKARRTTTSRA